MDGEKSSKKKMKKKLSAAIVKNESDEDQSDNEVTMIENGFGDDSIDEGWSSDDDRELIEKVKSISKSNDKVNYKTRLKQMNWVEIAFKNYTPEKCEKRFMDHLKHVRRHRTLNEIAVDIETNIKKCPIKKPLNSYQIFVKDQLMNATTSGDFSETMRNLANKYKNLTPTERLVYDSQSKILLDEYRVKKKQFDSGNTSIMTNSTPRPEKIKTPFCLYSEEHQGDGDQNQLREQYANLSIDEKYKWVVKAISLAPDQNITNFLKKDEQRIFKGQLKPPPTAYSLFVKEVYNEFKEKYDSKIIFSEIAQRWKKLDARKKKVYVDMSADLKKKAQEEQQAFNDRHGVTPKKAVRRKSVYAQPSFTAVKDSDDENHEETHITPMKKRKISASSDSTAINSDERSTEQMHFKIKPKASLKSPIKSNPVFVTPIVVKKEIPTHSNSVSESSDFNDRVESDAASSSTSSSSKKKSKKDKKGKSLEPPGEKPPSTIEKYFEKFVHTGKPRKAQKAFSKLSKKELKQLKTEYNEKVESYVDKLKVYLASLSKDEAVAYISKVKEDEDAERENESQDDGNESQE